jgi:HPt (histidine-containing phosphotransfer) domain-containing protein
MNKNIHHLFKTNPSLLDNVEVQELIEYCRELEGQYLKEKIEDEYNKEQHYKQAFKEIYQSCCETLKDDELAERFKETPRVDFKETISNLKDYMLEMRRLYKLDL